MKNECKLFFQIKERNTSFIQVLKFSSGIHNSAKKWYLPTTSATNQNIKM